MANLVVNGVAYDCAGWATKNDLRCSDGRIIRRDAFAAQDGTTVPLCYGHNHDDVFHILGHALLKNEPEGVRAYCKFNNSEQGLAAKEAVRNRDLNSLSIYAGHLKHNGADVMHGKIVEVSLVLAGANPGAKIEDVFAHGDDEDDGGVITTGEYLELAHEDAVEDKTEGTVEDTTEDKTEPVEEPKEENMTLEHEDKKVEEKKTEDEKPAEGKTVKDVFDSMTEEQKTLMAAAIGTAVEEALEEEREKNSKKKEEEDTVKHNAFEDAATQRTDVLSHEDGAEIIKLAKNSSVGSLKTAMEIFAQNNEDILAHGWSDETMGYLFPDYKDVRPGAPEVITRDQGWVTAVLNGVRKSPFSRIRTRQTDIRDLDGLADLRGKGYNRSKNSGRKSNIGNFKLLNRTTDPQTVYVLDEIPRDSVIDITDFDIVKYQYDILKLLLNEELACAIMVGDDREDSDAHKIHEDHIRPIWLDDEIYTIHADVDIETARAEIQGTNTEANFGENYIYAEAIVTAALYAREGYKGSGKVDFFCTPHLLNVMLLARDLNGRRIYDGVSDLARTLNVRNIYTAEQFENKTRTVTVDGDELTKKLLGIFIDLDDYEVGSTKGGEITSFKDFDINFNKYQQLIETRLSGANAKAKSAIALEEDVTGNP